MTDEETRTLWQDRIKAYRASKLSAVAWSEKNAVKVHMLRKWITTFNKENKAPNISKGWVPIEVSVESKDEKTVRRSSSSGIKINIGTVSIEISSEFDPKTLEAVVGILSKKC